jgi:hypothetical protein
MTLVTLQAPAILIHRRQKYLRFNFLVSPISPCSCFFLSPPNSHFHFPLSSLPLVSSSVFLLLFRTLYFILFFRPLLLFILSSFSSIFFVSSLCPHPKNCAFDVWKGRNSSVAIPMGYDVDGPCSYPGKATFFSSLQRPDRLWGSPSLLFNGYQGRFPGGKAAETWSLLLTSI